MKAGTQAIRAHKLATLSPNRYTYTTLFKMHMVNVVLTVIKTKNSYDLDLTKIKFVAF